MNLFRQLLDEALNKSQKQWVKDKLYDLDVDWKSTHKDWFNGKYRVYLPLDHIQTTLIPLPEIQDYIESKGYIISDYIGNKTTTKDGKPGKNIGKILSDNIDLLDKYKKHKNGISKHTNLLLCISRFPYDYASQSTGQSWTSCKDFLSTYKNYRFMDQEINEGWLIAYVTRENDKLLKKPLGRVLAIPYTYRREVYYKVMHDSWYGNTYEEAEDIFQSWLDERQDVPADLYNYELNTKGYPDQYAKTADGNTTSAYDVVYEWCVTHNHTINDNLITLDGTTNEELFYMSENNIEYEVSKYFNREDLLLEYIKNNDIDDYPSTLYDEIEYNVSTKYKNDLTLWEEDSMKFSEKYNADFIFENLISDSFFSQYIKSFNKYVWLKFIEDYDFANDIISLFDREVKSFIYDTNPIIVEIDHQYELMDQNEEDGDYYIDILRKITRDLSSNLQMDTYDLQYVNVDLYEILNNIEIEKTDDEKQTHIHFESKFMKLMRILQ